MVGEPVVGVHIFLNLIIRYLKQIIRCVALSGCLDTKLLTVAEADIYYELFNGVD